MALGSFLGGAAAGVCRLSNKPGVTGQQPIPLHSEQPTVFIRVGFPGAVCTTSSTVPLP
jgi:hypothetical protein